MAEHSVRAAAQHRHSELLETLRNLLCKDAKTSARFNRTENEGVLLSGDLVAAGKLPNDRTTKQRALSSAPLPVVQLLLTSEDFQANPELISDAAVSPDPRVLPWCHEHLGATFHGSPASLFATAICSDRLENVLYLLTKLPLSDFAAALPAAFIHIALRIIRHFFGPGKAPPRPREDFLNSLSYFLHFNFAPTESLQLLSDTGFLDFVEERSVPFAPDLAYLKLRIKLFGWDPRKQPDCLAKLVGSSVWSPKMERCVVWLIEEGAPLTAELFSLAASTDYRSSFIKKLFARGCPTSSDAYLSFRSSASASVLAERYWLLRSFGVPVPSMPRITPKAGWFDRVPADVLVDLVEQQTELISVRVVDDLFTEAKSLGRIKEVLPLIKPKLEGGSIPSSAYVRVLELPAEKEFDGDELVGFFNWILDTGCPVPFLQRGSEGDDAEQVPSTWRGLLRSLCQACLRSGIPTVLAWFVEHCGPVKDPRGVFDSLSAYRLQTRQVVAVAICDFLRSQGANIDEKAMKGKFYLWDDPRSNARGLLDIEAEESESDEDYD